MVAVDMFWGFCLVCWIWCGRDCCVVFDLVAFGLGGVCFWVGGLAVLLVVYCMLCCSLLCGFCGGLAAFVVVWSYSGCESGWV